jgi:hypothetical protein
MVPTEVAFYVVASVAGTAFQNAFDLADDESLREAGFPGVLAGVALVGLMLVPPLAGVVLGERARRLGDRRLGTSAVAVNAAIAAWVLFADLVGLAVA